MIDANYKTDEKAPDSLAFSEALAAVQSLMNQKLKSADLVLEDVMNLLEKSGGKNFRATLLLAAAADPAAMVTNDAVTAAAALEILHLATLVHDDVIDDAPTRRGQPSVQGQFGKKTAVISGDYLFCVCFMMIAGISSRYPDKFTLFSRAMTQVCVGEMRQQRFNGNADMNYVSYLRTIAGKTAALFALAMYSGGILGGEAEKTARQLGRIGFYIGMLFQLADDCLDYESTAANMKKLVKRDLAEGIITLPLILAGSADPSIKELLRSHTPSTAEIDPIIRRIIAAGGVKKTWAVADRYYLKASRLIGQLEDISKKDRLQQLLDKIHARKN